MANNKNITFDQLHSSMTKVRNELDKKANNNHGTHVEYYDENPKVAGTTTAGSSNKLSRGDHVHPAQTTITGNAGTATTLATARTLTIGKTGKSFDGSANVSWGLNEIGAAPDTHSHNILNIKGSNTISSTTNDTTANWVQQNNSVHWYSTAGQIIDQPSQYGFLVNLASGGDVHQIWMTQSAGNMYHRGGNGSGWSGDTWRTMLDSSNFTSYSPTLSGGGATGTWGISVSGNASTATTLQTTRKIGKASFNGTSDIYLSNIMGRATTTSSSNSYTYYITVTNEFEGINNIKVYFYNSDGTFNSRIAYNSAILTPGVPFKIAFPITTGTFRIKADFLTTNTLENISDRLTITKVVKEPSESTPTVITSIWTTGNITSAGVDNDSDTTAMRTDHMAFDTNSYINQYTKFARIDVSSGSYVNCAGKFSFMHTEDKKVGGILEYYFRTNETISSATIDLSWSSLTNKNYIDCISAVKVSDGVYDLYYQPKNHWDTTRITNIDCSEPDLITLYSDQGYVSSITPVCTSSLNAQYVDNIYTDYVSGNSLALTTNKYQYASITSNTTINLPSVSSFTEIHLFFDWPSGVSITMPSNVKWQEGVMYGPGYTHEFVFTYINSAIGWLGGCVVYG